MCFSGGGAALKHSDFAYYFSNFFNKYLPGERGLSTNTIASYEDTFCLLLTFMNDVEHIKAEKLRLEDITRPIVERFLDWLEHERGCSPQTRNVRLAALHSFIKYLQYEAPRCMDEWQKILAIPAKKVAKSTPCYTSIDGIKLILSQPDTTTRQGRRDLAMLSLLYDAGARVQEVCDLTTEMVRLSSPSTLKIIGKGNKARIVPLMKEMADILEIYMRENNLTKPEAGCYPLFSSSRGDKLTRSGVSYILSKYIDAARNTNPGVIPDGFSCHSMRHSKAMHMLQSDIPLIYIRDILGHRSVVTTEVYARVDGKKKREAIEAAYQRTAPNVEAVWHSNNTIRDFIADIRRIK
jgi:site-specific recombinase XerD